MHAITISGYGNPADVLRPDDIPDPTVTGDEVLVRVEAAAVNPADWHLIRGIPHIARLSVGLRRPGFGVPGSDFAGTVEATGTAVTTVQPAKHFGAEVTGVCSSANLDLVRSRGADEVFDYTAGDITEHPERFDLIVQLAGTHSASELRRLLLPSGTLLQLSGDSENRWFGPMGRVISGRLGAIGADHTVTTFTVQPDRDDLVILADLLETGVLRTELDRVVAIGCPPWVPIECKAHEGLMHGSRERLWRACPGNVFDTLGGEAVEDERHVDAVPCARWLIGVPGETVTPSGSRCR